MDQNKVTNVITFPKGIPGFEEYMSFQLDLAEDSFLAQLHSVEPREIRFFLVRPQVFFPDYLPQFNLEDEDAADLEVEQGEDIDVWAIITVVGGDITQSTVNLRAPLLINARTGKGIQQILTEEGYSSRQKLFFHEQPSEQPSQAKNTKEGAVG